MNRDLSALIQRFQTVSDNNVCDLCTRRIPVGVNAYQINYATMCSDCAVEVDKTLTHIVETTGADAFTIGKMFGRS